jgi:hypothetical protein
MTVGFNVGCNWHVAGAAGSWLYFVCHFGSVPGSSVLSFVIYGNHICVVHILSIASAGSTRNLLITEVIISVVACERSRMYI